MPPASLWTQGAFRTFNIARHFRFGEVPTGDTFGSMPLHPFGTLLFYVY